MNELILTKARKIQCLICDVDGVLTNGTNYLDNFGNELKGFNVQDGVGLKLLMAADIDIAVITTSSNAVVDYRMQQLGIQHYYKGQINKQQAFDALKAKLGLTHEAFAYIGDDLPDLPIMRQVGFAATVANAVTAVKEFAAWCAERPGGNGAVRELCDFILYAQNKQEQALTRYLAS